MCDFNASSSFYKCKVTEICKMITKRFSILSDDINKLIKHVHVSLHKIYHLKKQVHN